MPLAADAGYLSVIVSGTIDGRRSGAQRHDLAAQRGCPPSRGARAPRRRRDADRTARAGKPLERYR